MISDNDSLLNSIVFKEPIDHYFGGAWTEEKLQLLKDYLEAYLLALSKKSFKCIYIDAFAGCGTRSSKETDLANCPSLFSEEELKNRKDFFDGSVNMSLNLSRPVSEYWFNDIDKNRYMELLEIKKKNPQHKINVCNQDANEFLLEVISKYSWISERAVIFIDPYGANIAFETLRELTKCEALDIWLLFPVGQAINRMLTQNLSDIPSSWINRLNIVFGCDSWQREFYKSTDSPSLFSHTTETKETKVAKFNMIVEFYIQQLSNIFPRVSRPKLLFNKKIPLFALIFTMTNPKKVALDLGFRIVNHLIKGKK